MTKNNKIVLKMVKFSHMKDNEGISGRCMQILKEVPNNCKFDTKLYGKELQFSFLTLCPSLLPCRFNLQLQFLHWYGLFVISSI